MTGVSQVRIFFAIDLPLTIKEQVGNFVGSLKKKAKTHAIRWSRTENLHITLQFLAGINVEHIATLTANVRQQLAKASHRLPPLSIGKVHLFPSPYRPRVIVMEITPQEELAALSSLIGASIGEMNYPQETRAFRPHLTIGRFKYVEEATVLMLAEQAAAAQIDPILINEITLFRSDPQPDGSHYTVLERLAL